MWESKFPVAATRGTSVLGAGGFARPVGVGEPVELCKNTPWPVLVREGDIIVADVDGAVRVPLERAEEVAKLAREIREVDERCMEDVKKGATLVEAFKTHRVLWSQELAFNLLYFKVKKHYDTM
ncbi:hypothetical protein HDU76_010430 [Blyttiomyces sp. JEL0837]|nr:hypothetical protein HDU76_010430 [Blyttiomyces sp. JEL0837]